MDGWNTSFLLGWPVFRCYVSFRECTLKVQVDHEFTSLFENATILVVIYHQHFQGDFVFKLLEFGGGLFRVILGKNPRSNRSPTLGCPGQEVRIKGQDQWVITLIYPISRL